MPESGSATVPSAKRTLGCLRSSCKDVRTGKVEFDASEYTPASVGPETMRSCASSSSVCNSTNVMVGENTARITSPCGRGAELVTVRYFGSVRRESTLSQRSTLNRTIATAIAAMRSCQPTAQRRPPHGLSGKRRKRVGRLGVSIESGHETFQRGDRHVIEHGLRFNCRADALLRRQVLATACTDPNMRIDALPVARTQRRVDVPGKQRGDLVMLRIVDSTLVRHSMAPGTPAGAPLRLGKY